MENQIKCLTSSVLLILSVLSFVPQYRKITVHSNCQHISISYALCNTIVATQGLSVGLFLHISKYWDMKYEPVTVVDWLNLLQHSAMWLGQFALLVLCLKLPPTGKTSYRIVIVTYSCFAAVVLLPTIIMAFLPEPPEYSNPFGDRRFYHDVLGLVLSKIHPAATGLGVLAIFIQALEVTTNNAPGALSVEGLAIQAAVFGVVAAAWPWRFHLPRDFDLGDMWNNPRSLIWYWYVWAGWAPVNDGIFALGQDLLFGIAWWCGCGFGVQDRLTDDATPLLG